MGIIWVIIVNSFCLDHHHQTEVLGIIWVLDPANQKMPFWHLITHLNLVVVPLVPQAVQLAISEELSTG